MAAIGIVDYGLGNLHSVLKAVSFIGSEAHLVRSGDDLVSVDGLVIPGVGAFGDGMNKLADRGLVNPIKEFARKGGCVLGICLGMQFLFSTSEEHGLHEGLGLILGKVVYFPARKSDDGFNYKIPHIGWNSLAKPVGISWENTILSSVTEGEVAYFMHSYVAIPESAGDILAYTYYGGNAVTAAVRRGNIYGCQFHPEKSRETGISILRNFVGLVNTNSKRG